MRKTVSSIKYKLKTIRRESLGVNRPPVTDMLHERGLQQTRGKHRRHGVRAGAEDSPGVTGVGRQVYKYILQGEKKRDRMWLTTFKTTEVEV